MQIQGYPGLHREFQAILNYFVSAKTNHRQTTSKKGWELASQGRACDSSVCSVLQFPIHPMERKMSILKQDDQFVMTKSVKEGEVRVKAKWEALRNIAGTSYVRPGA